jgi:hypothetical protein
VLLLSAGLAFRYKAPTQKFALGSIDEFPLQRKWIIWEMWNQNARTSAKNFKDNMSVVSSFDSLPSFWQHWIHALLPPSISLL